jgi:GTP cyclohydrolase II
VETVPMTVHANRHNKKYLETKRDKMGHTIGATLDILD